MNAEQIIRQIEFCEYTCEAGPLENNTAWAELKQLLDDGLGLLPAKKVLLDLRTSFPPGDNHKFVIGKTGKLEIHILHEEVWQPIVADDDDLSMSIYETLTEIKKVMWETQGWIAKDS